LLRPTFNATGGLLDQASGGYEARLTANPMRGMRIRAAFSKTGRERESLCRFTLPMAGQLRAYVAGFQKKNPGVNVAGLADAPATTVGQHLENIHQRIDTRVDQLGNNFCGGKPDADGVTSYDFQGSRLKGWGTSFSAIYRSAAYTGFYAIREGGLATGKLLETIPAFGASTVDFGGMLRYRTRLVWLRKTDVTIQLNVSNLLDESDPTVRRIVSPVIAPGATPPTQFVPSPYFLRIPRSWTLAVKLDFRVPRPALQSCRLFLESIISNPIPTSLEKRTYGAGWIQAGAAAPSPRGSHETRRGRRVLGSPKLKAKTLGTSG